eukprot:sb/3471114/
MFPLILLVLKLLDTASSTPDGQLLPISSATAKTFEPNMPPELAIDGDPNTFYHTVFKTADPEPPQWLKLQLEEPALVSRVVIVNRYRSDTGLLAGNIVSTNRLLGTRVYLYDADGTTQIADCGKIAEVNTANLLDVTSQTYTLPCDTSQLASFVKLEDSEMEESYDAGIKHLTMSIAEVMVYGRVPPRTG